MLLGEDFDEEDEEEATSSPERFSQGFGGGFSRPISKAREKRPGDEVGRRRRTIMETIVTTLKLPRIIVK